MKAERERTQPLIKSSQCCSVLAASPCFRSQGDGTTANLQEAKETENLGIRKTCRLLDSGSHDNLTEKTRTIERKISVCEDLGDKEVIG